MYLGGAASGEGLFEPVLPMASCRRERGTLEVWLKDVTESILFPVLPVFLCRRRKKSHVAFLLELLRLRSGKLLGCMLIRIQI